MRKRIYGIETEYGLLIKDTEFTLDPTQVAHRVKDHIFKSSKAGVLDLHHRAMMNHLKMVGSFLMLAEYI